MFLKKITPRLWPIVLSSLSLASLLALQIFWLHNAYKLTYDQFLIDVNEAFDQAYEKEQTYRIPIKDIINPGNLTIQGCGKEEIMIIRKCPNPDTISYDNVYGQSLETFITRAFSELRESIVPLNIYCLADLFAGALHEKDIAIAFTIDHFRPETGEIIETTAAPGHPLSATLTTHVLVTNISATEGLRANLQFSQSAVLRRMTGILLSSLCLLAVVLACFGIQLRFAHKNGQRQEANRMATPPSPPAAPVLPAPPTAAFQLGAYHFDADKNELQGFGQTIQLNKKENGILRILCTQSEKVVARSFLLEEFWGHTGSIYSRSLDTYIAKLRRYLKEDPNVQIVTIKSAGYRLTFRPPVNK
jgi:hypothetical protein